MKIKNQRLNAIIQIITNTKVGSQEELLLLLEKEGFRTTQATLSRDLKSLKVAKQPDQDGSYMYVLPDSSVDQSDDDFSHDEFPLNGLISMEFSGNLAVIKTKPGFANGLGSVIDSHGPYEILGTIAGDDTLLVISRDGISNEEVVASLALFIPGLRNKLI
jgi:transcriptional regulator of arginine metabolism